MKKFLPLLLLALANIADAQVTITVADLPVAGDTLRYSEMDPFALSINLADIGTNKTWDFSAVLWSNTQGVDEYKTVMQVNPIYAAVLSASAYGYKVADTFGAGQGGIPLPIPLPVNITDVYTFYGKKSSPNRFVAEGFAASVSGTGIPAAYNDEDELYFLPLAYGNYDSSGYRLRIQIPTLGTMVQDGYRKTWVDGWGTIKTPYFTTPVNCIRIRTEINEIDSIQVAPLPAVGIPRIAVDYKWLVPGEHYPALWVSTTVTAGQETPTAVRYRDGYKPASIQKTKQAVIAKAEAYPNPATDHVFFSIPAQAQQYVIEVFDMQGKLVAVQQNNNRVPVSGLAPGNYITRITAGSYNGYASFEKM